MDRQGFLDESVRLRRRASAFLTILAWLFLGLSASGQEQNPPPGTVQTAAPQPPAAAAASQTAPPAVAPAKPPKQPAPSLAPQPSPAISPGANESLERRPYRISLHVGTDPSARMDDAKRTELIREWQVLVRRFVGSPWVVSVAESTGPLSHADLATLEAESFSTLTTFDKVWVVRIARSANGSGLEFSGREFDTATKRLSPPQLRRVATLADAPRGMLLFTRDLFNPTALITGEEGGRALLTVQGSMIPPASEVGAVVEKRAVFQPMRLISRLDGKVSISAIKHTYLQVESLEGPVARCAIVSALRDPLSKKVARPNSLVALGMKPGNTPLTLRFVTGKDRVPAAGYTLTARVPPDGQHRELGTTDRAGRIVLKPGFASELVILRLLSGNVEPIVELPVMPGESAEEFLISVDLKPLTAALESQLDSLRDEVVDLVALRARLESRMKSAARRRRLERPRGRAEGIRAADAARSVREAAHRAQGRCGAPAGRSQNGHSHQDGAGSDHRGAIDDRSIP